MLQELAQKLWYDRPVRTQLLVAVGTINLLAGIFAACVSVLNTRTATRVEIEASLEVAQRFVAATINDIAARGRSDQMLQELPLQLKHLRHVRIMLMDLAGQMNIISPELDRADRVEPPVWFTDLVRPQLPGRAVRVVTSDQSNPVIIVGEPRDEIAEAWRDFYWLALVWLALQALILVILYAVLGRVLDPLASLSKGMHNLEDGLYGTRLTPPKVQELARITNRFNTLASALDTAREENSRLYRQLISVQEEERRTIANELHDEAGPCLFGITANASSIHNIAEQGDRSRLPEISRRVGEILSIAERLKIMNRALLKKLRPGPLGRVKLAELIDELIVGFQRRHPDTNVVSSRGTKSTCTPEDTVELIRSLATHHPDRQIAAILNKQGRRTGTGLVFTEPRVKHVRQRNQIPAAPPPDPASGLFTIEQAATQLGVTHGTIYRWLKAGLLPGEQTTPHAPWRIRLTDEIRARFVPDVPDGYLPLDAAAKALGVARQTVLHKVQRGELAAIQVTDGHRKGLRIQVSGGTLGLLEQ